MHVFQTHRLEANITSEEVFVTEQTIKEALFIIPVLEADGNNILTINQVPLQAKVRKAVLQNVVFKETLDEI